MTTNIFHITHTFENIFVNCSFFQQRLLPDTEKAQWEKSYKILDKNLKVFKTRRLCPLQHGKRIPSMSGSWIPPFNSKIQFYLQVGKDTIEYVMLSDTTLLYILMHISDQYSNPYLKCCVGKINVTCYFNLRLGYNRFSIFPLQIFEFIKF